MNAEYNQLLAQGVGRGDMSMVREALASGADPNYTVETPIGRVPVIHALASNWSLAVADELVAAGADVNAVDEQGFTALIRLAQGGVTMEALQLAKALLAAGARVDSVTAEGRSALDYAAENARCGLEVKAALPASDAPGYLAGDHALSLAEELLAAGARPSNAARENMRAAHAMKQKRSGPGPG